MRIYMTQFACAPEAWETLAENPEDRSAPLREQLETMGGRLVPTAAPHPSSRDSAYGAQREDHPG